MGRAPCCDKANVKKGPWCPEEDAKLKAYIEQHGTGGNWIALPQKIGLRRCGKSCRLRWLNYLRPNIRHGGFSEEEDNIICSLYISIGSRWSIIAAQLPGRTDNDIKNYWNTRLKKKLLGKQRKEQQSRRVACALKQENKKENGCLMLAGNSNQTPDWPPQQPFPFSIPKPAAQDLRTNNDQASLRKLLIKLDGRFSDANDETSNTTGFNSYVPPIDATSNENFYGNPSAKLMSSSAPMNSFSDQICSLLPDTQLITSGNNMLLAPNDISNELEEIIYGNHPKRVEGLDCFYGAGMASESCGTSCGGSISWCDMSSLIHPSVVSINYEQGMFQECLGTDQTRYLGLH